MAEEEVAEEEVAEEVAEEEVAGSSWFSSTSSTASASLQRLLPFRFAHLWRPLLTRLHRAQAPSPKP